MKIHLPGVADASCQWDEEQAASMIERLPRVVRRLVATCGTERCYEHVSSAPLPKRQAVVEIVNLGRRIIFPGYFEDGPLDRVNLEYHLGQETVRLYELLAEQISRAVRHECLRQDLECTHCRQRGDEAAYWFIEQLPALRELLAEDVRAALEGDPATSSPDEVIFSYPGLLAITVYRLAHALLHLDVPMLPRMMTEHAHSRTGIDIHPAAEIGRRFFMDHGTGVVIGGTAVIGDGVRVYQGVTLGALSLPRDQVERLKSQKRHPTIGDDVVIYAGATILGGDTVVGARSVIGGNVWLTKSVPPDTRVIMAEPELRYIGPK